MKGLMFLMPAWVLFYPAPPPNAKGPSALAGSYEKKTTESPPVCIICMLRILPRIPVTYQMKKGIGCLSFLIILKAGPLSILLMTNGQMPISMPHVLWALGKIKEKRSCAACSLDASGQTGKGICGILRKR